MQLQFRKRPQAVANPTKTPLKRACHEFGRDDLYNTLRWVVSLRPVWTDLNLQPYLNMKRYVLAANAMLYESKIRDAKAYFERAMRSVNPDSVRYLRLSNVLTNLEVVSKIARRSWELDGKLATVS